MFAHAFSQTEVATFTCHIHLFSKIPWKDCQAELKSVQLSIANSKDPKVQKWHVLMKDYLKSQNLGGLSQIHIAWDRPFSHSPFLRKFKGSSQKTPPKSRFRLRHQKCLAHWRRANHPIIHIRIDIHWRMHVSTKTPIVKGPKPWIDYGQNLWTIAWMNHQTNLTTWMNCRQNLWKRAWTNHQTNLKPWKNCR